MYFFVVCWPMSQKIIIILPLLSLFCVSVWWVCANCQILFISIASQDDYDWPSLPRIPIYSLFMIFYRRRNTNFSIYYYIKTYNLCIYVYFFFVFLFYKRKVGRYFRLKLYVSWFCKHKLSFYIYIYLLLKYTISTILFPLHSNFYS